MIIPLLALTSAALFCRAAIYVLAVEHVARGELDDRAALTEWKPAYRRGAAMQATIALVATGFGAIAWWRTGNSWYGIGAILALLPWPWTLLFINPTNDRLLVMPIEAAGSESRRLLERWGRLHAVRMLLGACATVAFLVAMLP